MSQKRKIEPANDSTRNGARKSRSVNSASPSHYPKYRRGFRAVPRDRYGWTPPDRDCQSSPGWVDSAAKAATPLAGSKGAHISPMHRSLNAAYNKAHFAGSKSRDNPKVALYRTNWNPFLSSGHCQPLRFHLAWNLSAWLIDAPDSNRAGDFRSLLLLLLLLLPGESNKGERITTVTTSANVTANVKSAGKTTWRSTGVQ